MGSQALRFDGVPIEQYRAQCRICGELIAHYAPASAHQHPGHPQSLYLSDGSRRTDVDYIDLPRFPLTLQQITSLIELRDKVIQEDPIWRQVCVISHAETARRIASGDKWFIKERALRVTAGDVFLVPLPEAS